MNNDVYEGLNPEILKLALDQATRNVEHLTKIIESLRQRTGNLLLVIISVSSLMIPWAFSKLHSNSLLLFYVVLLSCLFFGFSIYNIWTILKPRELPVPALPADWFGEENRLYVEKSEETILKLLNALEYHCRLGQIQLDDMEIKLKKSYLYAILGSFSLISVSIVLFF